MSDINIYDLARWRPISEKQYVDELGTLFISADQPSEVITELETYDCEPEGRHRLVTRASVIRKYDNPTKEVTVEPYLLVFWYSEGSDKRPNTCFKRVDVDLTLC